MNPVTEPSPDGFWSPLLELATIDQVGLVLVGFFALLGILRGLWWQVVRLLGVVAAVALARGLAQRFTPAVELRFPELTPTFCYGIVWFVLFVAGLVVASLLGLLGKRALETLQLGLVDRVGGFFAGALTGAVLHSAMLVVLTSVPSPEWSGEHIAYTHSARVLDALARKSSLIVDAEAAERIGAWAPVATGAQDASPPETSPWEGAPADGAGGGAAERARRFPRDSR